MALFEKRAGAPAGAITVTTDENVYTFTDGNTTSVTDQEDIATLRQHPFIQQQGGGGPFVAPSVVEDVFLVDGVLSRRGPNNTIVPVVAGNVQLAYAQTTDVVPTTTNNITAPVLIVGASITFTPTTNRPFKVRAGCRGVKHSASASAVGFAIGDTTGTAAYPANRLLPIERANIEYVMPSVETLVQAPVPGQAYTYGAYFWAHSAGTATVVTASPSAPVWIEAILY